MSHKTRSSEPDLIGLVGLVIGLTVGVVLGRFMTMPTWLVIVSSVGGAAGTFATLRWMK